MLIPKLIRRVLPLALTPLRPFSQKIYEIAPAVFDEKNAQENMYFQLVPVTPKEAAELLRNGHPVVYDKPPVRRKHYDECASSAGTDKRDSSHKDDILLDYWYFDYLRTKTRKDSDSVTEKKPSSSDDMEDPYSSDQDPVSDFEE